MIDKGHISSTKNKNDKMLQATKLMHIILCLFTVLIIEVTTILAVEKIIVNSNVITIAATEKVISNSTENHDSGIESQLFCSYLASHTSPLQCDQDGLLLGYEYCATFNGKTKLFSIFNCPYFQLDKYGSYILRLPQNLSQLNDFMCGPLNRKGIYAVSVLMALAPQ